MQAWGHYDGVAVHVIEDDSSCDLELRHEVKISGCLIARPGRLDRHLDWTSPRKRPYDDMMVSQGRDRQAILLDTAICACAKYWQAEVDCFMQVHVFI